MTYNEQIKVELDAWKKAMERSPSLASRLSKRLQNRINQAIPDKVHKAITGAIKQMTRGFLFGAELTSPRPLDSGSIEERERKVRERIKFYRNAATAEGAITGAGGILLGLADFPIWLGLKMKMLSEIAALYGRDLSLLRERLFVLYIFELTFSSQVNRNKIFNVIKHWNDYEKSIPENINAFDWKQFQQEYRDYIDIAKLLQLVPGIGAAVGALVNHRLTEKLGTMAMNAYRLRLTT